MSSNREALLRATVEEAAREGCTTLTVEQVAEGARLPPEAFYEEFHDLGASLDAAHELTLERLVAHVVRAYFRGRAWPERVRLAAEAFLTTLAQDPALTRLATFELPALTPAARARYKAAMERLARLLRPGRQYAGRRFLIDGAELMALAGAELIAYDAVVSGRASKLPALLPDILFALLVPYLGVEAAVAEARRAALTG
jgi:AcrR family transcriptional regulator